MGEGLEQYIQNIFAPTHTLTNETLKLEQFSKIYAYQENKTIC